MGRRAVAVQSVHAPHSRQVKAARAPRLRQVDVTATSQDPERSLHGLTPSPPTIRSKPREVRRLRATESNALRDDVESRRSTIRISSVAVTPPTQPDTPAVTATQYLGWPLWYAIHEPGTTQNG